MNDFAAPWPYSRGRRRPSTPVVKRSPSGFARLFLRSERPSLAVWAIVLATGTVIEGVCLVKRLGRSQGGIRQVGSFSGGATNWRFWLRAAIELWLLNDWRCRYRKFSGDQAELPLHISNRTLGGTVNLPRSQRPLSHHLDWRYRPVVVLRSSA